MADVNNVITLGIGTPSSVEHFVLVGLSVTGEIAAIYGTTEVSGSYERTTAVEGSYERTTALTGTVE